MTIRPISSNPSFQGRLDASAQKLFAKKIKNVDLAIPQDKGSICGLSKFENW